MQKTIVASVNNLTKTKKELLDHDYHNYQWWMIFGIDHGLLSCFKAAKGYKQKVITYRDYPLPLWSKLIKDWFRIRETKLTKYWIKIPNSKKKGQGIWLPLKFHQPLPQRYTLRDSFLVKKQKQYFIHFVIDIPEPRLFTPKTVLGIDLGLKNPVTMVDLKTRKTAFLGKELKQVKGKYYHMRKKLGKEKNLKQIRKVKNKERRKVKNILHTISKSIVQQAYDAKAMIVIGKLKHLPKERGRRMNRKISGFSYFTLTTYIEYKARQKGVPFMTVSEAYTSQTCAVCGSTGKRTKNWFQCKCGYEDNADRNAAFNIGTRGLSYILGSGVSAYAQKSIAQVNGQAQDRGQEQVCSPVSS